MNLAYSSDTDFIAKITEITLQNLGNENFGVNELAKNARVNHTYLSQRLHKITNKSVSRFISEVRLEKAAEMLQNEGVTAAEAAYKVGFGSATYFNKCFHDFYGYPPGDLRKENHLEPKDEIAKPEMIDKKRRHFLKWNKKVFIVSVSGIIVILLFVSVWYFFINKKETTGALKLRANDKSIAVLPFKNLSEDKENQYFADGVMEDILNLLYRVGEFRVVSRTSVEQFRGSTRSAPEIARTLGVNFILEGSVQRYGDKVRINVQLIDARHDRQILSEKYDREFADIFAIQSGIAKQVADQLQAALSPNEIKQIEKIPTKNAEAYNLYLQGRFLWNRRTGEGIKKSIEYFNKAIDLDPNYALAYAGLADVYIMMPGFGLYKPKNEGHEKAYAYALKAVELDKNLAEAHTSLGFILTYVKWKWKEAEKELKLALKLNTNYAFAHQIYAQFLDITGDYAMARQEIDLALKLDPLTPIIHSISASLYYNEGNFDASLKEYQEALILEKNYRQAHWQRFLIYCRLEDGGKALDELQQRLQLDTLNAKYVDVADSIYAKSGLTGLINLAIEICPQCAAPLYAISGRKKEALTCLENYLEDGPGDDLVRLINKIDYETLRTEPRFKFVVAKLGLTEYYLKRVKEPGYIVNQ